MFLILLHNLCIFYYYLLPFLLNDILTYHLLNFTYFNIYYLIFFKNWSFLSYIVIKFRIYDWLLLPFSCLLEYILLYFSQSWCVILVGSLKFMVVISFKLIINISLLVTYWCLLVIMMPVSLFFLVVVGCNISCLWLFLVSS